MLPQTIQPQIKLILSDGSRQDGAAFGPGLAALCKGVRETGSLNAAAKGMNMAYSKAWRLIKETEEGLGVQLLIRNGAHGSTLTEEALKLVEVYDGLLARLKKDAAEALAEMLQDS